MERLRLTAAMTPTTVPTPTERAATVKQLQGAGCARGTVGERLTVTRRSAEVARHGVTTSGVWTSSGSLGQLFAQLLMASVVASGPRMTRQGRRSDAASGT